MLESDGYKVHEICVLKTKPNATYANDLLQKVSKQVQPILTRRQWVVPKLSEFYPRNAGLLGLNVGGGRGRTKEIKIRLRRAGHEESFFDFNHVLGTMLHEMVHNVRGPHDSQFYKLLDELWKEVEDLMDHGITGSGSGFDAASAGRLGSHSFIPQHNPPLHLAKQHILKAAEERAKQQRIMPHGPQKLGGSSQLAQNVTPAQAAAAAAERRFRDNEWCPSERLQHADQHATAPAGTGPEPHAQQAGTSTGVGGRGPASNWGTNTKPNSRVNSANNSRLCGSRNRPSNSDGRCVFNNGSGGSSNVLDDPGIAAMANMSHRTTSDQISIDLTEEEEAKVAAVENEEQQPCSSPALKPSAPGLNSAHARNPAASGVNSAPVHISSRAQHTHTNQSPPCIQDPQLPCNSAPAQSSGQVSSGLAHAGLLSDGSSRKRMKVEAGEAAPGCVCRNEATARAMWWSLPGCACCAAWMGTADVVDLTEDDEHEPAVPMAPQGPSHTAPATRPIFWSCPTCTLRNSMSALECNACLTPAPREMGVQNRGRDLLNTLAVGMLEKGQSERQARQRPMPGATGQMRGGGATQVQGWLCRMCTVQNAVSATHCHMCSSWRYTAGEPVAIRPAAGAWD